MVTISPTERLERITQGEFWEDAGAPDGIGAVVQEALSLYSDFLELTHQKKAAKLYVRDEAAWRERSYSFGRGLSNLIDLLGNKSAEATRLRRLITI